MGSNQIVPTNNNRRSRHGYDERSRDGYQRQTRRTQESPRSSSRTTRPRGNARRRPSDVSPEKGMSREEQRRMRRVTEKDLNFWQKAVLWFEGKGVLVKTLLVLAVVVLFMYGPLREYYGAYRDVQIRAQVLDQVNLQNKEHSENIEYLQNEDGIKDKAHELGYVDPGEVVVEVNDPENPKSKPDEEADHKVERKSPSYEIESPWYTDLLDKLFFYCPPDIKGN